jgi:hypothetical protein
MSTTLHRPLTREVVIGGEPHKVVMSPEGLRITPKGRRKGIEVNWESILALRESTKASLGEIETGRSGLPTAVAKDVTVGVRAAYEALTTVKAGLEQAGTWPALLLAEAEDDRTYGRREHRSDWFVEPLLTVAEVAAILRLTRNAVMRLPITSLTIAGEVRYRQSEIRRFLATQERRRPY